MTIQLLPLDIAAKIAAGEVVERPANVAKELIENSLDAGATNIQVEIREGGRRLLQVSDDGHGIPAAELPLAAQRHATSKLHVAADLDRITSFGFRGEALYSISAVSRTTLKSRHANADAGAELYMEGGELVRNQAVGLPVGTVVTVENIFFNTPARRKFLRRPTTEAGHIAAIVQRYALAYPSCRFKYVSDGKLSFSTEGSGRVDDVLARIYGREHAHQMIEVARHRGVSAVRPDNDQSDRQSDYASQSPRQPVEDEISFMPDAASTSGTESIHAASHAAPPQPNSGIHVSGYVSALSLTRPSRAQINLFVNRRYVQDRSLTHAVVQAYHTLLPVGRFPLAVIFLEIDPAEVDVNVHPRKTEVRFVDANKVFSAVQRNVRQAVIDSTGVPEMNLGAEYAAPNSGPAAGPTVQNEIEPGQQPQSGWSARRNVILNAGVNRQPAMPLERPLSEAPQSDPHQAGPDQSSIPPESPAPVTEADDTLPDDTQTLPPLRVVGQAGAMYVVAEGPEGLYLIDQHAAHERILYEKFMAQLADNGSGNGIPRQGLLTPISLHMGDARAGLVAQHLNELNQIGFVVEHFGGDTFLVRAVPNVLSHQDTERALDEIVQGLAENRDIVGEELEARLVKMVCKRASIKAGQVLSDIEMKELVRQLEQCSAPRTCPHGRPTMLQLSAGELERAFKRT